MIVNIPNAWCLAWTPLICPSLPCFFSDNFGPPNNGIQLPQSRDNSKPGFVLTAYGWRTAAEAGVLGPYAMGDPQKAGWMLSNTPPNSRAVCICEVGFGAGHPNHHITPYSMQISNSDQSREAVVPPDERFARVCIIFHFWLCESQSKQEWRGALDSYVRTPASVICTRGEITKTLQRR